MPLIKCPECNKEISDKATSCPSCGHPLKDEKSKTILATVKPSGGIAALISVFFPGFGHLYCGKFIRCVLWFFFVIGGYFLFIIPGIILHLLCIFDAYGLPTAEEKKLLKNLSK